MLRLPSLAEIRRELAKRSIEDAPPVVTSDDETRTRCKSLAQFVREAWHVLEPGTKLVWNWHLDAICAHLEAITFGTFLRMGHRNRLLINVPPGSSKSLIVSVMWQAWEWTFPEFRHHRFLATAFNDGPVSRDSRKCRTLLQSDWYRKLWPDVVLDRGGETSFSNTATGSREGVPFGSLTAQRGDRLLVDDPHSTEMAESDVQRNTTTRKFREGALNRLNDQRESAIVVIMQRLHSKDVAGVILAQLKGYIHLNLPMEFEVERRCVTPIFTDPREHDGDLLDPKRFPAEEVELIKLEMGSYAWAGQYQQRPSPREGALFKRHWFEGKVIRQAHPATRWVRHWDLAATGSKDTTGSSKSRGARTAGVKIGKQPDGTYVVGHSIVTREEGNEVRKLIKATAQAEPTVSISLPQDPGQAGKVQAKDMVADLAGYVVRAMPESGDKVTRAEPFSVQCEAGNVYLLGGPDLNAPWIEPYLDELCQFPGGALADQVDASSGAFGQLVLRKGVPLVGAQVVRGGGSGGLGDHPEIASGPGGM